MTHPTDFRSLCAELTDKLAETTDFLNLIEGHDPVGHPLVDRARAALATPSRPPEHCTPVQLCPVDRYTLSDAILAAWNKHGNDSWCSIADEVIAALAAPQQGAPSDEELLKAYYWACSADMKRQGGLTASDPNGIAKQLEAQTVAALRAVLTRYGAQGVPVAVAERLPGEGDCAPWPDDPDTQDWCWAGVVVDGGWEWHQRSPGIFTFIRDAYTHWLPHWALPLPEAQP